MTGVTLTGVTGVTWRTEEEEEEKKFLQAGGPANQRLYKRPQNSFSLKDSHSEWLSGV